MQEEVCTTYLVEESPGLLVERAVNGHDIALAKHVLERVDATAANLLLGIGRQRLVVVVEELLAFKGLETAENTLADTADGNGADDLALEVVLVLRDLCDVPAALGNHLVGRSVVADQVEDGHDDVLGDGDDVGASDLGDGDATVGLVGGVEVDVVGADTGGDGDLEVLGFCEAFGGEVTGVEAVFVRVSGQSRCLVGTFSASIRSGNDDLGVNEVLVECGVGALLVGGGDELVALLLDPLPQAELVLGAAKQSWLFCVLTSLHAARSQ